jgi:hypothetical protein
MPVDTALKRSSAVGVLLPWRSSFPLPDGALGQADRQVIAGVYSGILATGGPAAEHPVEWLVQQGPHALAMRLHGDLTHTARAPGRNPRGLLTVGAGR